MNEEDVIIEQEEKNEEGGNNSTDDIATVKRERQEYLDGWQRAKADYLNALKRSESEKLSALILGKTSAVAHFIPVLDSISRAQSTMEVPEAFQGIAKQIEQAFKSLNVEKFGEVGDVFSPHLHEALGNDAVEKGNEDTVTAVLEVGYRSGEAVLRHAKVRVGVSEA